MPALVLFILLHAVKVDTWLVSGHFLGWEGESEPRMLLPFLEGMECSKCGVAFVATCEI